MSGQSITDRIAAAQHSMTGSAISKAVCKATTHEVSAPKKKHLDCRLKQKNRCGMSPVVFCTVLRLSYRLHSLFACRFAAIYDLIEDIQMITVDDYFWTAIIEFISSIN